ncbi:MAG: hypothetical protein M3O71_07715 [Bacteroidota bacterium]|nr:hypothetical protein [Bacteroidota bacterium]
MNFLVTACIVLSYCVHTYNIFFNTQSPKFAAQFQEKTFKVQSLPFDINGLHLQYQYIVKDDIYAKKEDIDSGKPEEKVLVLEKKLVDLKRHVVVLDFPMESEGTNPDINLSDIDKAKYLPEDFDDANFDGYKDIQEPCIPCSGSMGDFETIYLFDPHTRKFTEWPYGMLINVEIRKENKTVQSFAGRLSDGGQFHYKEIKFIGHGTQLYEKNIDCTFLDEKKRTFKVVYNEYRGKKLITHKTRIITNEESHDPRAIVDEITK